MRFALCLANVDRAMPICPKRGGSWNGVESKIKSKSGFSLFVPLGDGSVPVQSGTDADRRAGSWELLLTCGSRMMRQSPRQANHLPINGPPPKSCFYLIPQTPRQHHFVLTLRPHTPRLY